MISGRNGGRIACRFSRTLGQVQETWRFSAPRTREDKDLCALAAPKLTILVDLGTRGLELNNTNFTSNPGVSTTILHGIVEYNNLSRSIVNAKELHELVSKSRSSQTSCDLLLGHAWVAFSLAASCGSATALREQIPEILSFLLVERVTIDSSVMVDTQFRKDGKQYSISYSGNQTIQYTRLA